MNRIRKYIVLVVLLLSFLNYTSIIFAQVASPAPQPSLIPLPSPDPEPPSNGTPAPPEEPSPDDPYPFYGCGGTGQKCCVQEMEQIEFYRCLFKDDEPAYRDDSGKSVDKIVRNGSKVAGSCTCQPKTGYSANAIDQCKDYFTPSKREEIVIPGLWPNDKRPISPDDVTRLNNDLAACTECSTNGGMYSGIGCIPYNFEGFVQAFLLLGIGLGGAYALFCIIIAAIRIQTSKGDTGVINKSRESVTACLIGLALILFSAFITNIFSGGLLGFSISEPLGQVTSTSEEEAGGLMCSRQCIYSEKKDNVTRCYNGACPSSNPECGKPKQDGVVPINNDCRFAPQCGNYKEVPCP